MGRIFVIELEGRTYNCKFCKTHLALADDIVSQAFHSRRGKAYLFNNVVNINLGPSEDRQMLSGMHTVADVYCCCCGQIVGWKYVIFYALHLYFSCIPALSEAAHEKIQKYKEGKYVIDRSRIMDGSDDEFYIDGRFMSDAEDV